MEKRRVLEAVIVFAIVVCMVVLSVKMSVIEIEDCQTPLAETLELVTQGEADVYVMPDKYNTGCNEASLIKVNSTGTVDGLYFKLGSGDTTLAVDFLYGNSDVSDIIHIKNYDFSDVNVEFRRESEVTGKKKIVFENCKFATVRTSFEDGLVSYVFNNCTMNNFVGSNATLESCRLGGTIYDAVNPYRNVSLRNCYIADMAHGSDRVLHSDGTQIYGKEGLDVQNIEYFNCRMEVPSLPVANSNAGCYVNACLMVQLEYSNANNLLFEHCTLNGGGYSIYAWDKGLGYDLNNVVFKDIQIGNAHGWGNIYHTSASTVVYDDVRDTDSLYVGSVWKDSTGDVHLSVTNDTGVERTLIVVSEQNGNYCTQEFVIDKFMCTNDMVEGVTFDSLPIDIDIEINGAPEWVVCYDGTISADRQIRYYNWGSENVYRESSEVVVEEDNNDFVSDEIIVEDAVVSVGNSSVIATTGSCGSQITYSLDGAGNLHIEGSGTMWNYTSLQPAPWDEYADSIKSVSFEGDITTIGNQAFRKLTNLEEVQLPQTLVNIGTNAFLGCTSLQEIHLPVSLQEIGKRAFNASGVVKVTYEGTEDQFVNIDIASYNTEIENAGKQYLYIPDIVASGTCGDNVEWKLSASGELLLSGVGATYNYSSGKCAPWYSYREDVKQIEIEEGITVLGEQLFRKCINVERVELPSSVNEIKKNAFIGCSSLETVTTSNESIVIHENAFAGTKVD